MNDLIIAIRVGSPGSSVKLVGRAFDSFRRNIGACDWRVLISLGLNIDPAVSRFVKRYVSIHSGNFRVFQEKNVSWASFINAAIREAGACRYFVKSHDDIELLTGDFYGKVSGYLERLGREVGWVSFTDTGWKYGDFSPSVRSGYHIDHRQENGWDRRKLFQFHVFPENWWKRGPLADTFYHFCNYSLRKLTGKTLPYPKPVGRIRGLVADMPAGIVRCHAPFNHFVLIRMETLNKIGDCDDWGTGNALLVDEDWGLRALRLNFPNIWVPDIEYFHFRGNKAGGNTRSWDIIKEDIDKVEGFFLEKWGFHSEPTDEELEIVREKFKNTLIPWSMTRRSYDWDYL
ncbi:MAG: hypothetical protein HQL30_03575 [Candidatus Omnitrophica bacterium]|nr:hypothetical protein [Candidatus Omnitrophota bacterium]